MNDQQVQQWVAQQVQSGNRDPMQLAGQLAGWGVPQDMIIRALSPLVQPQQQAPAANPFGQQQAPAMGGGGGMAVQQGQASQGAIDALGARLGSAKDGNAQGRKLPAGVHLAKTTCMRFGPTFWGDRFIHEYIVLESSNSETEIGGTYSIAIDPNDQYGYGLNDIRALLNQAVEHKLNSSARVNWDPKFLAWAIAQDQPCSGIPWRIETHEKQSKNSNNVKMIHEFSVQPAGTATLGLVASAAPAKTTAVPMQAVGNPFAGTPAAAAPNPFAQAQAPNPFAGAPTQGTPMTGAAPVPAHIAAMFGRS